MLKINDDVNIYFPLKLLPRKKQIHAFRFTVRNINDGKRFILLDLPTGTGKSYFSQMFINWYRNYINKDAKVDILTNSKILQNQYIKDYNYIKDFKGKSNYYCEPYNTDCNTGMDICKLSGPKCGNKCPHQRAKSAWISADIGLTNFHLFNVYSLFIQDILESKKSNVLIIDEAHDFEETFAGFITTSLYSRTLSKYGFSGGEVENYTDKIIRIKTLSDYVGFIEKQFIKDINNKIDYFKNQINITSNKKLKKEYAKYKSHCETQVSKFNYLISEYDKDKNNWVLDKTYKEHGEILLEAKPVWVNNYLKETIFDKYDHVIFMSGTILNKQLFSEINGLSVDDAVYFKTDTPFKIENRKIYYMKIGKMSYKDKFNTFQKQIPYIKKILKKYKDKKGIIHTSTYEFANWIQENIHDKRLIFHKPDNKDDALQKHLNSNLPTVLVSPSMHTGVDLKNELSRFQIIMKIKYPFLGSTVIKKRKELKPKWYSYKTVVNTLQQYGRSIRSMSDYADTFIIDSSFSDLMLYSGKLIPEWFTDAVKILKIK